MPEIFVALVRRSPSSSRVSLQEPPLLSPRDEISRSTYRACPKISKGLGRFPLGPPRVWFVRDAGVAGMAAQRTSENQARVYQSRVPISARTKRERLLSRLPLISGRVRVTAMSSSSLSTFARKPHRTVCVYVWQLSSLISMRRRRWSPAEKFRLTVAPGDEMYRRSELIRENATRPSVPSTLNEMPIVTAPAPILRWRECKFSPRQSNNNYCYWGSSTIFVMSIVITRNA